MVSGMIEKNKMRCQEQRCGWTGKRADLLKAVSPFEPDEEITGCPNCKGIDCMDLVCDEPGCCALVSCGTPTAEGYRHTCVMHKPVNDYAGWQRTLVKEVQ